jgi:hypothetical protein
MHTMSTRFGIKTRYDTRRVTFRLLALGESPRGHVLLHHGTFPQLMPNRVHMIGAGCLKKLLDLIRRLPCLALDVTLGSGDELLVGVIGLLVVVTLVAASSDHDSWASLLRPPLVAFGAPRHTLITYS